MPYFSILFLANLESLKDHREKISKSFFKKILSSDSCLHSLLPPERNTELLCKFATPQNILFSIPELKDTSLLLPEIERELKNFVLFYYSTRMWANAQPDGRPAEHRWRPLFNAAKFA